MRFKAGYSLSILFLVYLMNYVDRVSVGIFADHMKRDLGLSDTQIGLLTGLLFAFFYAFMGIPVGRLADKYSRKAILSSCLAIWSIATAACGVAQNFAQLAAARMIVGIGEAGCTPSAHSYLSDLFSPKKRATAFSIYSMGPPIGLILAAVGGGWVAYHWGWRLGMIALGVPGLLLALVILLTLNEPERGRFDTGQTDHEAAPFQEVIGSIIDRPRIIAILFGIGFCAVGLYSVSAFSVPFLMRAYQMDVLQAGLLFGLSYGVSGALGAVFGGAVTDWAGSHDERWYTGVPMIVYLISGPVMALAFFQGDYRIFAALFVVGSFIVNMALAPAVAVLVNMMRPRMRASTSAIALFFAAVIGHGLGPTLTGFLSDVFSGWIFVAGEYGAVCTADGLADSVVSLCENASYHGLQYALALAAGFWLVAGLFYAMATFGWRAGKSPNSSDPITLPGE